MDPRVVAVLRLLAEIESGWWTYRPGGFDPLPPWEAHARRHQR